MHPRIAELLNQLAGARQHLDAVVSTVPVARRETRPAEGRWSVADVLEHLSIVERQIAHLFEARVRKARAEGIGPDPDTSSVIGMLDVDRVIDRRTRIEAGDASRPTGIPFDAALRAFDAAHQRLRHEIAASDGVALDRITHPHRAFGELNLYQWGLFVGAHERRHAAQVRAVVSLES